MSATDFELPAVELPFTVPAAGPPLPFGAASADDGGVEWAVEYKPPVPEPHEEEHEASWGWRLASAVTNLMPGIGPVKGVVEALLGEDIMTSEGLALWERALNIAVIIPVPEVEEASEAIIVIKEIHEFVELVHKAHHTLKLTEVIVDEQPAY
jgi:hypothetical protein